MRTATFLISIGFLLMAGCSERGSTTAASAPSGMTNSELEQAIQSRLNADPDLAAAKIKVDADAKANKVTLSGTVSSESLRTRAVEIAKSVRPDLEITDKIEVKPREVSRSEYTEQMARDARERAKASGDTIGSSIDDAWIHTKIASKLIVDKDTPARKINIDVADGVVTLRGEVDTPAAKQEAERIAKETEGVKRVRNLLKVTNG
ncbi:MAG: osmY [Bryobacterales bacterium]|nr:osmY [Bryobacterales bacterium]